MLESTRRFLRPLVGIDPATVRVHRGPAAARAAEAAGADALAWGEEVVLPPTHDERTPGGLGLLAHELTHVARRREPRFVPPIARGPGRAAPGARGRHPAEPAAGGEEGPLDEEGMAGRVERLVRAQAREAEKVPAEPASSAAPPDPAAAGPGRPAETPAPVAPAPPAAPAAPGPWGELPAPWEPMPPLDGAGMTGAAGPAPVFRAATDRGEEEPASPPAGAAPAAEAPAPDLDALARQVYDVLKRRLAAERRREG